ncbi:MAG: hypothetical protein IJW67_08370, partial [Blautia sp.]|nr:hypothetical protein [Blautia sp.]
TKGMINAEAISKMRDGVRILNYSRDSVVDEDAILAAIDSGKVARFASDFPTKRNIGHKNVILTPHLGEMSRLSGKTIEELKRDLPAAAAAYAEENHCTVVLKDAGTVTAGRDGTCFYNLSGNPCMAVAGSGDVLSGILGACICLAFKGELFRTKPAYQKAEPYPEKDLSGAAGTRESETYSDVLSAAAYGVFIHGRCGDLYEKTCGQKGMKAGDLLRFLPEVINQK